MIREDMIREEINNDAPCDSPSDAVRAALRGVSIAMLTCGVVVVIGAAVPAFAHSDPSPVPPPIALQGLLVPNDTRAIPVARDHYGVTVSPSLVWPVAPTSAVSDGFGRRTSPCSGCSTLHEGADLDAGSGAVVRALAAGVVVESGGSSGLGVHVIVRHIIDGQIISSVYAHLRAGSTTVRAGDPVSPGLAIGNVGNTGASTGDHLHFEIRLGGTTAVDPLAWLHARLG